MRIAALIALVPFVVFCQTPPAFEAASIKPNKSGANAMGNRFDPGLMSFTNNSLVSLLTAAYRIKLYQIAGMPRWAVNEKWDVEATSATPTNLAQKMERLRTLIAERFRLAFHWETRQVPEFNLEVAKGGLKIQPADPADTSRGHITVRKGLIEGQKTTMATLVEFLGSEIGQPVFDKTGLAGEYNFRLEWLPDESQPNGGHEVPGADASGAPVFTAIHELGLHLAPIKGPLEVMVVDHVERPEAN